MILCDLLFDLRKWYTPIHAARDACKQQLIDFKKEVQNLEEQQKRVKRQQKKKSEEKGDAEQPEEGKGTSTDKDKIKNEGTTGKKVSEKVRSSWSKM